MKKICCKINGDEILPGEIFIADSFYSRLMGLMFTAPKERYGLLLVPGHSIHTCFMRFDLDILFIDKDNKILKIIYNLKPWRVTKFYFNSQKTLELPAGCLPKSIKEGEQLEISYV